MHTGTSRRSNTRVSVTMLAIHSIVLLLGNTGFTEEITAVIGPANAAIKIDRLMEAAISKGDLPGAVIVAVSRQDILYAKAFGHRQLEPTREPMTLDTVFDLASLTKPIATASSIMILVDEGKLSVEDKVATYLPEFAASDKTQTHPKALVRVKHLLLHTSGLIPDNALSDYQDGHERAWENICSLSLRSSPGSKFAYSDVGFIVLQKLVEERAEMPLDQFAGTKIFDPLGMGDTSFRPTPAMRSRIAPTERRDGEWIRGDVHDPRAFALGGVAGHAGLFSSASDLVTLGRMMLGQQPATSGTTDDARRIMSPATWRQFTEPRTVEPRTIEPRTIDRGTRTYGWDHRSPYSSNRGTGFSDQAFGHGGFTGTVQWIDPKNDFVFVFLSSRLHPDGEGNVNSLAGKVATLLLPPPPP